MLLKMLGPMLIVASIIYFIIYLYFILKKSTIERTDIFQRKIKIYNSIDNIITRIKPIEEIKKELQLKLGVINSNSESKNRIKAVKIITYFTLASFLLTLFLFLTIKDLYFIFAVAVIAFICPYGVLFIVLNMRLAKLRDQFPDGVNMFITKYSGDRNKDRALQKAYSELDNPIKYEFMRLARMMSNKSNIIEAIRGFNKRINYIWADVFGELLMLNHTSVGDISLELNELSILIQEEQTLEAQQKAELSSTKWVNIASAIFVVLSILFNILIFNGEATHIYFERYIGITSITISTVVVSLSLFLTVYYDKT